MLQSHNTLNITNDTKPPQLIDVTFRNINYFVQIEDQKADQPCLPCRKIKINKTILKNLSGIFKAGQLTAIMGASGAGKTTLLNALACRIKSKNLSGQIKANGVSFDYNSFGDFANYVMQQDILMETLTVRQTLEFAANLKLNLSQQQKKDKISRLVRKMKLERCLDTVVGGQMIKGISGGEKKRTSIAFQLISDPLVLVLDEPTSGLDSLTSFIIVRYLKQLVTKERKTIFMTIHQPNTQIYQLFDRLMLMVEGNFIYQGSAADAPDYFSRHFGLTCGEYQNPADYFMSIMHHQSAQNRQRYGRYFQAYEREIGGVVESQISNSRAEIFEKRTVDIPFCTSLGVMVRKDFVNTYRNPMLLQLRIVTTIFMALYTSGLYYRFNGNYVDRTNWRSLTGYLFFISISTMMMALNPMSLVFPKERDVFLKEEGAKLYSTSTYFLSRNIIEIPVAVIFPMIQALIVYWFVGLNSTVQQFFIFYLIAYLLAFNGASLGLMLGSMILDQKSVAVVTPIVLLPVILFSGFFKNTANLSMWAGWIQYISPIKYSFIAFVENQVQYASASFVGELNFDLSMWMSIGLLVILAVAYRLISLFFLWLLRSRLE